MTSKPTKLLSFARTSGRGAVPPPEPEIAEEAVGHLLVVMLSSVNQAHSPAFVGRTGGEGAQNRGDLHEVGSGAGDVEDGGHAWSPQDGDGSLPRHGPLLSRG